MSDVFDPTRNDALRTRPLRTAGPRRRGTALLLAVALLGILFVMGVAFMASMNSHTIAKDIERSRARSDEGALAAMEGVRLLIGSLLDREDPSMGPDFANVELPLVSGLTAPIEPVIRANGDAVFLYHTDLERLTAGGEFDGAISDFTFINSKWPNGSFVDRNLDGFLDMFADADGDGIVDSKLVNAAKVLKISEETINRLSELLNGPLNPDGDVFLGVRVIPHGGMVNWNEAHPEMIRNLVALQGRKPDLKADRDPEFNYFKHGPSQTPPEFYSAPVNESTLRRRFFLPPRVLSPSLLQGNPFEEVMSGDPPGGGDMGGFLFPLRPGAITRETVFIGDHRYFPYVSGGDDDDWEEWAIRMNPLIPSQYDLRHLVTLANHDDLLAFRGRMQISSGVSRDMVELMIQANRAACVNANSTADFAACVRFRYPDYPFDLDNPVEFINGTETCLNDGFDSARGPTPTRPGCKLDPRKGRLKLSLPWLQDQMDDINNPLPQQEAVKLVQDVFTLMLLESKFKAGQPLTFPEIEEVEISAASLTANLFDYADPDEFPEMVEIRSANLANPGMAGTPTTFAMFGVEQQPYITEVAAFDVDAELPGGEEYAIEIFNPSEQKIRLDLSYSLRIGSGTNFTDYALRGTLGPVDGRPSPYMVVSNPLTTDNLKPTCPPAQCDATLDIKFKNGDTIYLMFNTTNTKVVVDQFTVSGTKLLSVAGNGQPISIQRPSAGPSLRNRWLAPLPSSDECPSHTLGGPNQPLCNSDGTGPESDRAVEAILGGSGDPDSNLTTAFPTTGSLLLLMQYANRSIIDAANFTNLAFTSNLGDPLERVKIDNGHMPVFGDSVAASMTEVNKAGDRRTLPWGQHVFDYFTALPLENSGPYRFVFDPNRFPRDNQIKAQQPRSDLGGLRVHGRVDLNAAPWRVLAGTPYIPMQNMPPSWRGRMRFAMGFVDENSTDPLNPRLQDILLPDDQAGTIGERLARAIVAYRDAREIFIPDTNGATLTTGDYDVARGWDSQTIAFRRGTGFLSVGELANVRHADASLRDAMGDAVDDLQIDRNMLMSGNSSYTQAVARLVALSDWVTTRSQVFTVYGVLRGEQAPGEDSAEVDQRSIRFQETIDRLPTILGKRQPVRLGERVLSNYKDSRND